MTSMGFTTPRLMRDGYSAVTGQGRPRPGLSMPSGLLPASILSAQSFASRLSKSDILPLNGVKESLGLFCENTKRWFPENTFEVHPGLTHGVRKTTRFIMPTNSVLMSISNPARKTLTPLAELTLT